MRFIMFLVRFVEKGPKTANSRQCRGSFAAAKVLATVKDPPCHSEAEKEDFSIPGFVVKGFAVA